MAILRLPLRSRLKEPEGEILVSRAETVAMLEPAAPRHLSGLLLGKRDAVPGVIRGAVAGGGVPLNFKFEERSGAQQPVNLANIAVDHVAAGDVLEDVRGVCEIELERRNHSQIAAVVLIELHTRAILERNARTCDHFSAYVHGMDLAKNVGQGAREASGAAADLEDAHLRRILALADVHQVAQDLFADGEFAGCKERLVGPIGAAGVDVITRVLPGALRSEERRVGKVGRSRWLMCDERE